jgi:hypothetical protein
MISNGNEIAGTRLPFASVPSRAHTWRSSERGTYHLRSQLHFSRECGTRVVSMWFGAATPSHSQWYRTIQLLTFSLESANFVLVRVAAQRDLWDHPNCLLKKALVSWSREIPSGSFSLLFVPQRWFVSGLLHLPLFSSVPSRVVSHRAAKKERTLAGREWEAPATLAVTRVREVPNQGSMSARRVESKPLAEQRA